MPLVHEIIMILFVLVFSVILFAILVVAVKSPKKGGGNMSMLMLGTMDAMLSNEKKKAAEVIVEQKAGKKLEEQGSKEPKEPGKFKLK
ncbi:MAG: hypothetical protein JXB48_01040 [Candidatus Latescibacteria bacterium]|nr:hypothetical protein [Candidatus Latescibacterota bacterium]